jgi:predicted permease
LAFGTIDPSAIIQVLLTVIGPILAVIAIGFMVQKLRPIDTEPVSKLVLHIFLPCLVFSSIVNSAVESSASLKISIVALVSTIALIGLSWIVGKALRLSTELMIAFVLSISFVNAGNYGLPVILFAFGEDGLGLAVIFFIINLLLMFTVGVVVASQSKRGFSDSLNIVIRLPLIYALLAAVALRLVGTPIPRVVINTVEIMGQAAIPLMLIMLGLELGRSELRESRLAIWKLLGLSATIKLLFPIIFVSLFSELIGLGGLAAKVAILQASMPTAVLIVILTVEFGGDSQFATKAIALSTIASTVTLTLLLSLMR